MLKILAKLFLFLAFSNCFVGNATDFLPNYEWNLNVSLKNVQMFNNFMAKMYNNYNINNGQMIGISEKRQRMEFFGTFAKFATQLANDCIMMKAEEEEKRANSNDETFLENFEAKGYGGSDTVIMEYLTENFNAKVIKTKQQQMPKAVLKQILMLTFSFAARLVYVLLPAHLMFDFDMNDWKNDLEILFSAFKILSTNNYTTNSHGIFPYRFVTINNYWEIYLQEIHTENVYNSPEVYSNEQMQYIENFKFVLHLSDFSLTPFEVHKILETIKNEAKFPQFGQSKPAIYSFLEHFISPKIGDGWPKFGQINCLFVLFGRLLFRKVDFFYSENQKQKEYNLTRNFFMENCTKNEALLKRVFNEQIRYFGYSVGIDYDYSKELRLIAGGLHNIFHSELNSFRISRESTYNKGIGHLSEFNFLIEILEEMDDLENLEKFKKLKENFEQKISLAKKMSIQKELLNVLNQIIDEYECTNLSPMCHYKLDLKFYGKNIPKFGQILFEALRDASDTVKYDGTLQSLAFPKTLGEHLLERLHTFVVKMLNSSMCQIGEKFDFVKTVQNVASSENPMEFSAQRKTIPSKVNAQLFKLLFSLAIRLTAQMESEELAGKYLNNFIWAYKSISNSENVLAEHCLLQSQLTINGQIWKIEIPNWKSQLQFAKSTKNGHFKRNFDFLLSLSNFSPTIYEIIQMLKTVGETNGAHFLVEHSAPEVFLSILNFLMGIQRPFAEEINVQIQKTEFCVLTYFLNDFLERIICDEKRLFSFVGVEPIEMTIDKFELIKEEFCAEGEQKEIDLIKNYFNENFVQFAKAVKIEFNPYKEISQILTVLKNEIKKMLQFLQWDFATFNCLYAIEWSLLRIDLGKVGQSDKWQNIEKWRNKWRILYNKWVLNKQGTDQPNFAKPMRKIVEILNTIPENGIIN